VSFKISDTMHHPTHNRVEEKKPIERLPRKVRQTAQAKVGSPVEVKKSAAGEKPISETGPERKKPVLPEKFRRLLPGILWGFCGIMFVILVLVALQFFGVFSIAMAEPQDGAAQAAGDLAILPDYTEPTPQDLTRAAMPKTTIPERSSDAVTTYTVQPLDSIFGMAQQFNLKPESILWANMDVLQDDPQMIAVGQTLFIPPVDGVYYKWREGDTLESVSGTYHVSVDDILEWPGNNIDLTNPVIQPGEYIMIPGGVGVFRSWVVPVPFHSGSGAAKSINNQCTIPAGYPYGTGAFMIPLGSYYISGNDFWAGHLGVDLGGNLGDPVYASDSGVVIYAGGMAGGYGNVVVIEHDMYSGVIYYTLYAHLSGISVSCGQGVYRGQVIGAVGSTGNSTGPHLHFEIREGDEFINPHSVLGY
jgi:LysM repeat protein